MSTADPVVWPGSVAQARQLQAELATRVSLSDDLPALERIAGLDVGFEAKGSITRAAVVLLDARSLKPLAEVVVRLPTVLPYIPGLLSFRELPALLEALTRLSMQPDLLMVDGQGIAHPRRMGIAAHLGVVTGLPSIGVAKKILIGQHAVLGDEPGSWVPLLEGTEVIGQVLRSKRRCRPLIISPGHRVCVETAGRIVRNCLAGYRLPEPTRLADRLASRRDPDCGGVDAD